MISQFDFPNTTTMDEVLLNDLKQRLIKEAK